MYVQLITRSTWLLVSLIILCQQVEAANIEAAKVIMAKGSANAIDNEGESRELARRSIIYVGDTLTTGSDSMVQLRFTDKAVMTLRENTRFQIEEYEAGDDAKGGAAVMKLLEGGFRTITGSIGKGSSDTYKVSTNAASIGIRGTHYEALEVIGQKLLVAVWQGGIKLENPAGQLNLGQDVPFSYAEISPGQTPTGLAEPPQQLQQGLPLLGNQARRAPTNPPPSDQQSSDEQSSDQESTTEGENPDGGTTVADNSDPMEGGETSNLSEDSRPPNDTTNSEFTDTQEQTNQTEFEEEPVLALDTTNPIDELNPPEDLNFTETNPDLTDVLTGTDPLTTASLDDPRLTIDEFNQISTTSTLGSAVITGPGEVILATIISMQAPASYDYSTAGSVNFGLQYYHDIPGSTPVPTDVVITLQDNITDINSLIADIEDELTISGAPIGVRESTMNPGKLEFYTTTNDETLQFGIVFFDTTSSTATDTDLSNSLGGIMTGTYGFGGIDYIQSGTMKIVYDANGEPVFLVPDVEYTGGSVPPPEFIDPSNLGNYEVARRGEAVLSNFNPNVGGHNNISWGVWNASPSNPVYVYQDPNQPSLLEKKEETVYWLTAEAANTANLTGTATFAATPDFLGTGSDGAVTGVTGSFDIDFDSGDITNGALNVMTVNQNWTVQMDGVYENAQASMDVLDGQISGSINCTNCVTGRVNGIFVEPGDAFAGGFDLQKYDDANTHVEGLLLMEKQ
ncbi:hypothetical protein BTA51_02235 [Hahella sp. CCB-MM4]|uniref:FecR family protein n=1 Tax=Hahella sp. (strain CCB-MM4) TaxID=1926491 RepID=UPI000B9B7926|nr:FecR family protein [Hahella sp. CCB-MM4]OZG75223.1 hypothetical protein BTA51_02235 [Hahella sp. CCB-MM4]